MREPVPSLPDTQDDIIDAAQRAEVIDYIREMTKELSVLAERAQCAPLSDCLRQAYDKANAL
ncbi:hypothetical protein [Asticcacaulis sp. AND118]|uniref:hypothetical protein n=1 Tax=Asticcacaulis sp. AND118 TaxID=2840468 RepID=UPI001CFF931C|nr:hypothetical protein [Asticcacaulis sp. AND118]UDF04563.1 hypothetical protein LH365_05865 [Asticcacaulis sp. AND118]